MRKPPSARLTRPASWGWRLAETANPNCTYTYYVRAYRFWSDPVTAFRGVAHSFFALGARYKPWTPTRSV